MRAGLNGVDIIDTYYESPVRLQGFDEDAVVTFMYKCFSLAYAG
ncbi:MAG: hypothetical protein JWR16_1397 [Nevskia sp.]|nr:hypothetical protein [Nevskia sp.]